MSKSSERFSAEWEKYKKEHNNISVEAIIEQLRPQKSYYRERFSKFKNDEAKLDKKDVAIFSSLFGIREEYLAGIDDYRTDEDYYAARQKEKGLFSAMRQILLALGYADTHMKDEDYNPTFPPNTHVFLEECRELLKEDDVSLLCDVNADTYVAISTSYYEQLVTDVVDYLQFKLDKLFANASPMPSVEIDGKSFLHPSTSVELKDGSFVTCDIQYTPNSEYDGASFQDACSFTEHKPDKE